MIQNGLLATLPFTGKKGRRCYCNDRDGAANNNEVSGKVGATVSLSIVGMILL